MAVIKTRPVVVVAVSAVSIAWGVSSSLLSRDEMIQEAFLRTLALWQGFRSL